MRINASDAIRSLVDEIAVPEGVRPDADGIGDACAQDSESRDPPPREQLTAEAALKGIDREFRRPVLRGRALSARFPRRWPPTQPPRPNPVHPSTSTRALSFLSVSSGGRLEVGTNRRTGGEPGWTECQPRWRTNSSSRRRGSRFEGSTTNVLKLQGTSSMVAGHGRSWAPSGFCSRLGFLETRNRSIKDGLDGLSLDSAF
jgi:hypothetical protein